MNKALLVLTRYKIAVILLGSFIPYIGAHSFRQNDTLGVTMRYWMRWFHEDVLHHPLLPAVINPGEAYGISPMEFPLLNFLTVPGFVLGLDYGRFGAIFLHSLILLGLLFLNHRAWKDKKILGEKVGPVCWLFIIFGCAHFYFTKYMPDALAFLLMSLACASSWEKTQVKKSLPLAALALLVKPPVVFLFALYLLKDIKTQFKNTALWALPAVAICLLYYKWAVPKIIEISDIQNFFALELRNPAVSLGQFFSRPEDIFKLFTKHLFTSYLIFILIADGLYRWWTKRPYPLAKLWVVFFVQVIASAALIGEAGFVHAYYFISTSFCACLLFKDFLQNSHKVLITISLLILSIYTLERSIYTIRPIVRGHDWYDCRELNKEIPKDQLSINTFVQKTNPILGICMSKRQTIQSSKWGLSRKGLYNISRPEDFELVKSRGEFDLYRRIGVR